MEVGEAQRLVELGHIGLVDALDGEAACANVVLTNEVGEDALSDLQMQFVGHHARDEQSVG